jgi:transcriptional regulator with XRE-family HTH domain
MGMNSSGEFGKYLCRLLEKYNIKGSELADALEVSRQYVSKILSGQTTPSGDTYDNILSFLDKHITQQEENNLSRALIYARTKSKKFKIPNDDDYATTVGEKLLLKSFRNLNQEMQMDVIQHCRQKEIETLDLMADLAELHESRAAYEIEDTKRLHANIKGVKKSG